ncbi:MULTISPECIES: hypothetical protein [Mycolicibacterium]|uniref:hypothetical protein n=1 Tax=Mycolicibacterium TaxID=1866885 RepID=UPI000AEFA90A|nr:hypothetical protein [Mycolicibacterium porcinum]
MATDVDMDVTQYNGEVFFEHCGHRHGNKTALRFGLRHLEDQNGHRSGQRQRDGVGL